MWVKVFEQGLHPGGDEVLFEETVAIDLAFQEIGKVKDCVAPVAVEDAGGQWSRRLMMGLLGWRALGGSRRS
jgi:hypothetical protein